MGKNRGGKIEREKTLLAGWFRRISTIIIIIIITLLLGEGILHIIKMPLPDRFFEPNDDFGWFHIPGRSGWHRTPELQVPVTINSLGLRDIERDYQKLEGVFRILLLGDSFTEGLQVPWEQTFGVQLERVLNEQSLKTVEVINAGVSKFGTDNELLFYQYEGMKYQPDLVILLFFYNDVHDNVEDPYFALEDGRLIPVEPKPLQPLGPMGQLSGWLWDHFEFFRLLKIVGSVLQVAMQTGGKIGDPIEAIFLAEATAEMEYAWSLTSALMGKIEHETALHGAQFLLVGIADRNALSSRNDPLGEQLASVNQRLAEISRDNSLDYVDLLPGFQDSFLLNGELLFWPGDGHWNATGHRLAAEIVSTYLLESGFSEASYDEEP